MESIYACKLYRSSTRKDKIRAAIANPLNAELVTQLESYLDEPYQQQLDDAKHKKASDAKEGLDHFSDKYSDSSSSEPASNPSGHSSSLSDTSGPLGPRPSLSEKFAALDDMANEDMGDDGEEPSGDLSVDSDNNDSESLDGLEEIDESTSIPASSEDVVDLSSLPSAVVSLLDDSESSSGINRALVKGSELWVYYNDDINLNNVMGPAIELLNQQGLDYLEFNRLARSQNAIVFQIETSDKVTDEEDIDVA